MSLYAPLNVYIEPSNKSYTEPWKRVLSRLGDYTATIVRSLNMRPVRVDILAQTYTHLLVRISTPGEHVVLRIAPERHLATEVYFGRKMAAHHLPAVRIIKHDLTRALVPFDYVLESYVGGHNAAQLTDPHLLRSLARQAGRALRRMHRVEADGWGAPTQIRRWETPDWLSVLTRLQDSLAPVPIAILVFGQEAQVHLERAIFHPLLHTIEWPCLMHGALTPQVVRCTVGTHVNLEALVDPGRIVGGDGLLDLALALDPTLPPPWCTGLLEGYESMGTLDDEQQRRLWYLHGITCYWSACQRYMRALPHEDARDQALTLLDSL